MRARPLPGLLRLVDRYEAGPGVEDAVRVAAEVVDAGWNVALEHAPSGRTEELPPLIARLAALGLASRCELAVPVDALGRAGAESLARQVLDAGFGVALEGAAAPVDALAAGLAAARVVVAAADPGAEERCRALADGRVRLLGGPGRRTGLAFVRCLNVLMSGAGHPAIATADPRLIAITGERAAWNDRSAETWEHVMPYGLRTDEQQRLTAAGYRVRVTVPWGPGAPLAVLRRLAGRP